MVNHRPLGGANGPIQPHVTTQMRTAGQRISLDCFILHPSRGSHGAAASCSQRSLHRVRMRRANTARARAYAGNRTRRGAVAYEAERTFPSDYSRTPYAGSAARPGSRLLALLVMFASAASCEAAAHKPWWKWSAEGQSCPDACGAPEDHMCSLNGGTGGPAGTNALKTENLATFADVVASAANSSSTRFHCTQKKVKNENVDKWNKGAAAATWKRIGTPGERGECKYSSGKAKQSLTTAGNCNAAGDGGTRKLCCCRPSALRIAGLGSTQWRTWKFFCPTVASDCVNLVTSPTVGMEAKYDEGEKRCVLENSTSHLTQQCPANMYRASAHESLGLAGCVECAAGYASAEKPGQNSSASACEPCAAGRWRVNAYMSACQECPAGKFGATRGMSSESKACNQFCAAGTFGGGTGQTSQATGCGNCSAGKFSSAIGLTGDDDCSWCPAGRFGSARGSISMQQCVGRCPAGRYGVGQPAVLIKSGTCGDALNPAAFELMPIASELTISNLVAGSPSAKAIARGVRQGALGALSATSAQIECARYMRGLGFVSSTRACRVIPDDRTLRCAQNFVGLKSSQGVQTLGARFWGAPAPDKLPTSWEHYLISNATLPQGCSLIRRDRLAGIRGAQVLLGRSLEYAPCSNYTPCVCKYDLSKVSQLAGAPAAAMAVPTTQTAACPGACSPGRFSNRTGLTSNFDCKGRCEPGRWSNVSGLTSNAECSLFPSGTWSTQIGATSAALARDPPSGIAEKCPVGRFSTEGSSECAVMRCTAPKLSDSQPDVKFPKFFDGPGDKPVLIKRVTTVTSDPALHWELWGSDGTLAGSVYSAKYGDAVALHCGGEIPPRGPTRTVCNSQGVWDPDPTDSTSATMCAVIVCPTLFLPAGVYARLYDGEAMPSDATNASLYSSDTVYTYKIDGAYAPQVFAPSCSAEANILLFAPNELARVERREVSVATAFDVVRPGDLTARCDELTAAWTLNSSSKMTAYSVYDDVRCQCPRGTRRGDGKKATSCVQCPDVTYAPLDARQGRGECRACPREGVGCIGGVLDVLEDWWFEVPPTLVPDAELKLGMQAYTKLYKCSDREACLRNTTAIPMTMFCAENHTSVLCASCYHRRASCARKPGWDAHQCVAPGYFQRGIEWMYFAKIARQCKRCPAGSAAYINHALTAVVAIVVLCCIALLVVGHLANTRRRLQDKLRGNKITHNSTGPIARLLMNWMQATALLSSIKLTPPEAVQEATVWSEYGAYLLAARPVVGTCLLFYALHSCSLSATTHLHRLS